MKPRSTLPWEDWLNDGRARGITCTQLAREIGKSPEAVNSASRRYGIPLRLGKRGPPPKVDDWDEALASAKRAGLSYRRAAAELGVSAGAVFKHAKKRGLTLGRAQQEVSR